MFQANTLEKRLQELNNEKTALARELRAAAQIVRVDVGPFLFNILSCPVN